MKKMSNFQTLTHSWRESGVAAPEPFSIHSLMAEKLLQLDVITKYYKHHGVEAVTYEDLMDLLVILDFFIDIFGEDLKPANELEAEVLQVFRRYAWTKKVPEKYRAFYVRFREYGYSYEAIISNEKKLKELERKETIEIRFKTEIFSPTAMLILAEMILRTAKKLGVYGIIRVRRPKVILEEPEEVTLPKFSHSGVTLPITEIANNVLYSLVQYARVSNVKNKMTWLRTALAFLAGFTFREDVRRRVEDLLKELEKIQRSVNWDVYEVAKDGQFELIPDEEYQQILEKLARLERIRDETIDILLTLGLNRLDMAKLGERVPSQRN